MTAKRHFTTAAVVLLVALFFCGCAPQADVSLKFAPDQAITYKAADVFRKDYFFDEPSSNKKTKKVTEVNAEVVYDQLVTGVDANQNATADITIKAVKYFSTSADAVQVDFDSSREADAKSAFAKLIGQSYTVKISPSGKVLQISNVDAARSAVKTGPDARLAARLLGDEGIQRRHEILAMPDQDKKTCKVGDKWSRIVPSPPGVLIPKTYEKIYTVKKIDNQKGGRAALIVMNATPTSKQTAVQSKHAEAMEVFGNFFDSNDTYSGQLRIDLDTGKVHKYFEKLRSQYTAAEFPRKEPQAEQPDVLELTFTEEHRVEAVD